MKPSDIEDEINKLFEHLDLMRQCLLRIKNKGASMKDFCINGHNLNETGRWRKDGTGRQCRLCESIRKKEYYKNG